MQEFNVEKKERKNLWKVRNEKWWKVSLWFKKVTKGFDGFHFIFVGALWLMEELDWGIQDDWTKGPMQG